MRLPILVINKGDSEHLSYCLQQARRTNPDSRLILLGDDANAHHADAEHHPIVKYNASASEFAKVYEHLSLSSVEFELFCFQRWFIIKDFMEAHGLECAFYMDSDVMLLADISEARRNFTEYELAYTESSGHSIYINSLDAIRQLCSFMTRCYSDPAALGELREKFERYRKAQNSGGISDMACLYRYRKFRQTGLGNLLDHQAGSTFDECVNISDGYQAWCGKKRFRFSDDGTLRIRHATGALVRFNSLHFQGQAKPLMAYVYRRQYRALQTAILRMYLRDVARRATRAALGPAGRRFLKSLRRRAVGA